MKLTITRGSLPHIHLTKWFKFLPLLTGALLMCLTAVSVIFLHRHFYQTIAQLRVVSVLQNQVAFNQVNLTLYKEVFSAWEKKKQFDPASLEGFHDPFQSLAPLPAPPGPSLEEANNTP